VTISKLGSKKWEALAQKAAGAKMLLRKAIWNWRE